MTAPLIRKPTLNDAPEIQELIQHFAARKVLLPRSMDKVCQSLRDFFICEEDDKIVACGALHFWSGLVEIRSLAVAESHQRQGLGTAIVEACLEEAQQLHASTIFVLTYQPEFFERLGFQRVNKDRFPHKIWTDCANCPQFPNCSEVALVKEL